jgi:hypothetical protein
LLSPAAFANETTASGDNFTSEEKRSRGRALLIGVTIVLDPSVCMTVLRIAMRPVDDAAPLIPLILAVELDRVSRLERADAPGEIDIVRDQHRVPRREAHDETLMAAAFIVVGKDFGDAAAALNLNVAAMILECRCQSAAVDTIGTRSGGADVIVMLSRKEPALRGEVYGRERNRYGDDPFHCPTQ